MLSIKDLLKRVSSALPVRWQQRLKRRHYAWQIGRNAFGADEPEYDLLPELLKPGSWAIDVGANIGHYTLRLSELVGSQGRVVAFEPVPATFELLASNAALTRHSNVTLINAAASDEGGIGTMEIPNWSTTRLANLYDARLSVSGTLRVLRMTVDALQLNVPVSLVKVDAEGHELSVMRGMRALLQRDHPTLIVEGDDAQVEEFLRAIGYGFRTLPGSWNRIYSA